MGFFTDPYNDFGRLSSELWRAVRLVLDTGPAREGLDGRGSGRLGAGQLAAAGNARSAARCSASCCGPAQATTYKIGMITIQKLRDEAKAALGDKFDWKSFHDTVIGGGGMPLPVLEKRVRAWIETQKAA